MKSFKGRKINPSKVVHVYRNLTRGGYSIKQGGLVVAHCNEAALHTCSMHVNEKGRQRVVKSGRKQVHAWVIGYVTSGVVGKRLLRYNPKESAHFKTKQGKPVMQASVVSFHDGYVLFA